jgi:hypothetical protein
VRHRAALQVAKLSRGATAGATRQMRAHTLGAVARAALANWREKQPFRFLSGDNIASQQGEVERLYRFPRQFRLWSTVL